MTVDLFDRKNVSADPPARPGRVALDPDAVRAAFEAAESQEDYILAVYKMVFPDWDRIERIDNWPGCSEATWKAIAELAMAADARIYPLDSEGFRRVMLGGAWLNTGFTNADPGLNSLKKWEVTLSTCTVTYKRES